MHGPSDADPAVDAGTRSDRFRGELTESSEELRQDVYWYQASKLFDAGPRKRQAGERVDIGGRECCDECRLETEDELLAIVRGSDELVRLRIVQLLVERLASQHLLELAQVDLRLYALTVYGSVAPAWPFRHHFGGVGI